MSSLYQSKSIFRSPESYIVLEKPNNTSQELIRFNNNSLSILDNQGKIMKEVFTSDCKALPINLSVDQIMERSLVNNIDEFVYGGKNMSVFFIGSSGSGKEKLFDGSSGRSNTTEDPLISYFVNYAIPMFNKKFKKVEIRMKMAISIKEKVYDCLSENRYSIIKLEENPWEGTTLQNACTVIIENSEDFLNEIKRGVKQKSKLIMEYKELYVSYLELEFVREHVDNTPGSSSGNNNNFNNDKNFIISKLRVFEVPGVEILGDSHSTAKFKESSSSVKSLLNFTALLEEYSKNEEFIPYAENSVLTLLSKDIISSNSLVSAFFVMRVDDVPGALATSKFIKPFTTLRQYPIINESITFGLLRKYRAEAMRKNKPDIDSDKGYLENEVMRMQTEEDYQRIMEKYVELKQKYNQALKAKSEAQLELIKCEEEKIEIGKTLVEVQIENTKLLEKLQSKDYENGKRLLSVENRLAEKEMGTQEMLEKLQETNEALNEALETKRDLEVEFIALKRNFLLIKKELEKVKEDNQQLSLDVINITNHNERLKNEVMNAENKGSMSLNARKSIIQEIETEKQEELKREIKDNQQTISYLKSEVERYKKELIDMQLNTNQFGANSRRSGVGNNTNGKDYERIELESENMELANRLKLKQRKIDEIEEKLQFYEDENENLENELRRLKIKDHEQTAEYRKKLEELVRTTKYEDVVKELRDNFNKKDVENLDKVNAMKREIQELKRTKAEYKRYIRELITLLEEYSPKGVEIPDIKKYLNLDLTEDGQPGDAEALRIKNRRLEEEIRRLKEAMMSGTGSMAQSRVKQEYDYLKNTSGMMTNNNNNSFTKTGNNNQELERLRQEKSTLYEENKRLAAILKDSNKMDLGVIKKENEQLRKQLEMLRNENIDRSSISPSTNNMNGGGNSDQKIVFYEKHIKKIEKERSELLSRCVVAEEQVKNLLAKIGKGGMSK